MIFTEPDNYFYYRIPKRYQRGDRSKDLPSVSSPLPGWSAYSLIFSQVCERVCVCVFVLLFFCFDSLFLVGKEHLLPAPVLNNMT